jgi:peptide/nickel transport system permease protein
VAPATVTEKVAPEPPVVEDPTSLLAGGEVTSTDTPLRLILRVFAENRAAMVGLAIVILFVLFCFLGPIFYHTSQVQTNLPSANQGPSLNHLLGTDNVGYDILGRLMSGGQTSLEVGLAVSLLAAGFGVIWGAVSGFIGGITDSVLMRVVDALLAIPTLFLLLFLATIFTPSVPLLILVIAFVAWLVPARLVRGETLSLRTRDYVAAARVMGAGQRHIVLRHIIPNAIGTIVVNATFQVADAILAVASLSFLGLGVPPPAANWGGMLSDGVSYVFSGYWWQIWPAGVCIVATVVAFNVIGDGLRDAFEVRLQRR